MLRAGLGRGNDPKNVKKEKLIGAAGKLLKTFPVFDSITSAIEKQESKGLTLGWRFIVCYHEEDTVFSFQRQKRNFIVFLNSELFLEELRLSQV